MTVCRGASGYPADPPHRNVPQPHVPPPQVPLELRERPARHDTLPEHVEYSDKGCDVFHSCLRCPLPRCRYDEPGGVRAILNRIRDREIRRLRREHELPVDEIARRFRVSRRTVFRALRPGQTTPAQPARKRLRKDATS